MSGSPTFYIVGDRLTCVEIEREYLAETVADLNITRALLAAAFARAEASDVSSMPELALVIDGTIGALDRIIERVDLYHE